MIYRISGPGPGPGIPTPGLQPLGMLLLALLVTGSAWLALARRRATPS